MNCKCGKELTIDGLSTGLCFECTREELLRQGAAYAAARRSRALRMFDARTTAQAKAAKDAL